MAQVRLLKIDEVNAVPIEFALTDEVTLGSYTVNGVNGPVLSLTGLDLNTQDISDLGDLTFADSSTGTITVNATAFIADRLMFETKENNMTTAGAVLFPVVTDAAGELDAFRLPAIAGTPTATPADGGTGYLVYDSTNNKPYIWTGTIWDDLSTVSSAQNIVDSYTAEEAVGASKAVYISSADSVSLAKADVLAKTAVLGFTKASALITASVEVVKAGILAGFTGLTAGARYYLSATAGAITTTIPTGTGNVICQVGYAKNATSLDIQILQLGRRAV